MEELKESDPEAFRAKMKELRKTEEHRKAGKGEKGEKGKREKGKGKRKELVWKNIFLKNKI